MNYGHGISRTRDGAQYEAAMQAVRYLERDGQMGQTGQTGQTGSVAQMMWVALITWTRQTNVSR
jgi:hypothetical protein